MPATRPGGKRQRKRSCSRGWLRRTRQLWLGSNCSEWERELGAPVPEVSPGQFPKDPKQRRGSEIWQVPGRGARAAGLLPGRAGWCSWRRRWSRCWGSPPRCRRDRNRRPGQGRGGRAAELGAARSCRVPPPAGARAARPAARPAARTAGIAAWWAPCGLRGRAAPEEGERKAGPSGAPRGLSTPLQLSPFHKAPQARAGRAPAKGWSDTDAAAGGLRRGSRAGREGAEGYPGQELQLCSRASKSVSFPLSHFW